MISKSSFAVSSSQLVASNFVEEESSWTDVSFETVCDFLIQKEIIQDFKKKIDNWFKEVKLESNKTDEEFFSRDLKSLSLESSEREEDSNEVLDCLLSYNYQAASLIIAKHTRTDSVVGLMRYEKSTDHKPLTIESLVTHPGTSGLGGLLLEKALTDSKNRKNGMDMVDLVTWKGSQAVKKYECLGLMKPENTSPFSRMIRMTLDPVKSKRWALVDGCWKIQCI